MGQLPKKTYTAPDGSVFRVEDDGSVTKIKSGRISNNERQSKYQTPEGKIYRVEPDGALTYLGNAEDKHTSKSINAVFTPIPKRKNYSWIWKFIVFIIIAVSGIALFMMNFHNDAPTQEQDLTQNSYAEQQNNLVSESAMEETSANENAEHAFICDGNFHGKIGNADIHGNLTLDTEYPFGRLYYNNSGSDSYLDIDGSSDGKIWTESLNGEITGTIYFNYWNLAFHNFARGTYVRQSDGKEFSIELYKSNF